MMPAISDLLHRAIRTWQGFWFAPTDPIVVSLLRWFAGGMVLYTLLVWGVDLEAFFLQEGGWQSRELVSRLLEDSWARSFWWLVPDDKLWWCHLLCLAIVCCFCVGFGTTVTKWLTLMIVVSYSNRVPLANYGLDQINAMLTLYLCLGPCGARLSLDRWLQKTIARRRGTRLPLPGPSIFAGFTVRMVQVHMCIIYFFAGVSKLQGVSWWNGTAVWRAAANYEYQQASLTWLADVPWLYQAATIGTWLWEISFAFLIWNRYFRYPMLLIGVSMHLGIGMFMGMWTFGLVMCFAYIAFLPPQVLQRALRWLRIVDDDASTTVDRPQQFAGGMVAGVVADSQLELTAESLDVTADDPDRRVAPCHSNTVVCIDPSLRNRANFGVTLQSFGFDTICVNAWPEAVDIFRTLQPRSVICNRTELTLSELAYWAEQLRESRLEGYETAAPVCVALVRPEKVPMIPPPDDTLVVVPMPVQSEDLAAILDGHVPLHWDAGVVRDDGRADEFRGQNIKMGEDELESGQRDDEMGERDVEPGDSEIIMER